MSDHKIKKEDFLMTYLQKLNMERRRTLTEYQSDENIGKLGKDFPLDILIAEDQLINQRLMTALLKKFGYNAVAVNNGKEAFELVKTKSFDLVLMDIEMPIMNGVEATKAIMSYCGETNPNVVAYTTKFANGDLQIYSEIGIEYIIRKPATLEKVLPAILSVIKKIYAEKEI